MVIINYSNAFDKSSLPLPLKNALELIEQRRAIEALHTLSTYTPDSSTLATYNYLHARAYSQTGEIYKAVEYYRLAYIYAQDKNFKEKILFERAKALLNNKHYDEAAICYKIFLQQFPNSNLKEEAYLGFAESLYNLGRFNDALLFYQKAGNSLRALYGKADTLQAMGRVKEAHEIYLNIVNYDKGYMKTQINLYNIGENFRLMNKLSYAKVYFAMIKNYPFKYKADLSSALIAVAEGRMDQAVKLLESAKQSPDRTVRRKALLYLSEIYIMMGKSQEAKNLLIEIRNKYPYGKDYDEALLKLASLYKKEGEIFEAAKLLQELIFRKTPDRVALNELEILLIEARNRNNQEFLRLWKSVGQWLLEPSRTAFISKILRDMKPLGKQYFDICKWLIKHGSEDERAFANLLLAEFFAEMGDISNSQRYLQNSKKMDVNLDQFNRVMAIVSFLKGEQDKSLMMLTKIRELKEGDIKLLMKLSTETAPTLQNLQYFANYLKEVVGKSGGDAKLNILLADILYKLGKKIDALSFYRSALNINEGTKVLSPEDINWCLYRISILSDKKETLEVLKKVKDGKDGISRLTLSKEKENLINEKLKELF